MRDAGRAGSAESLVQWFGSNDDASRPPRVPCRQPDGSYDLCYPKSSDKIRIQRACRAKVFDNCRAGRTTGMFDQGTSRGKTASPCGPGDVVLRI